MVAPGVALVARVTKLSPEHCHLNGQGGSPVSGVASRCAAPLTAAADATGSNMHIRPTVQSASNVTRDAGCLGLSHERGDLDALRRSPQSMAVDHGVAEHNRADAGSLEDQPVNRHARGLNLLRVHPSAFQRHQTVFAERDRVAAARQARAAAAVHLAKLHSCWLHCHNKNLF